MPTLWPFRLQVYFNQHPGLANQLRAHGIACEQADNTFVSCGDWAQAQALVAGFEIKAVAACSFGRATRNLTHARVFPQRQVITGEFASFLVTA